MGLGGMMGGLIRHFISVRPGGQRCETGGVIYGRGIGEGETDALKWGQEDSWRGGRRKMEAST